MRVCVPLFCRRTVLFSSRNIFPALVVAGHFTLLAAAGRSDDPNYDESRVPAYQLPSLLIAEDGSKVDTKEKWMAVRRPELQRLFEENVFGRLPPSINKLRIRLLSSYLSAHGKALRRELTVFFSDDDAGPKMNLLIYTPAAASTPVPCFLGLNFGGNQTVEGDTRIQMTSSWVRNAPDLGITENKATEVSRGSAAGRWPVEQIMESGYGLATAYYGDIDPDFDDGFRNGIHQLFPESPAGDNSSGGSISAWAWGLSRALDVLLQDSRIDGDRVAVIGHSRLGKAALWAGAADERFAMVISNNSGCGGAALSRRRFGETVARINKSFPHWFCRNHRKFNDNEDLLPVDHHMLIALAAPRPVYVGSAEDDRWADPRGEYLAAYHASPAYQLFGLKGLPSDIMPPINEPSAEGHIGYHIRSGKHDINRTDWGNYLRFADQHLKTSGSD